MNVVNFVCYVGASGSRAHEVVSAVAEQAAKMGRNVRTIFVCTLPTYKTRSIF
jgi:hypothetical protein